MIARMEDANYPVTFDRPASASNAAARSSPHLTLIPRGRAGTGRCRRCRGRHHRGWIASVLLSDYRTDRRDDVARGDARVRARRARGADPWRAGGPRPNRRGAEAGRREPLPRRS